MNTKIIRKILTGCAIAGVAVAVGLLIYGIFNPSVFDWGPLTKIMVSAGIICAASAFAITAVGYINKQKVFAFITLVLLLALVVLSFIIIWKGIAFDSLFTQITVTVALVTIPFCSIVDNTTKLGGRFKILQIITYVLIIGAIGIVLAQIWGLNIFGIVGIIPWLIAEFLLAFLFWIILLILARKGAQSDDGTPVVPEGSVIVSKEEYESLKAQVQQLRMENQQLKQQMQFGGGYAPYQPYPQYQQPYMPNNMPPQQPVPPQPQPAPQPQQVEQPTQVAPQPVPQPQEVPRNLPKKLPRNLRKKQETPEGE